MKKLLILPFLFFIGSLQAQEEYFDEISLSVGMAAINYTEGEKVIEGENVREPAAGSANIIAMNLHYRKALTFTKSWYLTSTFPLLPSSTGTYLSFGGGVEFYFNDVGTKVGLTNSGTTIMLTPKFRYFWHMELNGSYLVYVTETAKKSDAIFEFGPGGGFTYSFNNKWAVKSTMTVLKGAGVVTSTFGVKVLVGATMYMD
jgi:hypothetical protein